MQLVDLALIHTGVRAHGQCSRKWRGCACSVAVQSLTGHGQAAVLIFHIVIRIMHTLSISHKCEYSLIRALALSLTTPYILFMNV